MLSQRGVSQVLASVFRPQTSLWRRMPSRKLESENNNPFVIKTCAPQMPAPRQTTTGSVPVQSLIPLRVRDSLNLPPYFKGGDSPETELTPELCVLACLFVWVFFAIAEHPFQTARRLVADGTTCRLSVSR